MRKRTFFRRRVTVIVVSVGFSLALVEVFLIYDRYVDDTRFAEIQKPVDRINVPPLPGYTDYKGVVHVHSYLSKDSEGSFEEIAVAAKQAGLHFVLFTDHNRRQIFSTDANMGQHDGILFVRGAEIIKNGHSVLAINLANHVNSGGKSMQEVVDAIKSQGGLAIIAHPGRFDEWDVHGYDGMEVYDIADEFFLRAWKIPYEFAEMYLVSGEKQLESFYVDLLLTRPDWYLGKWDKFLGSGRKMVAIASIDAHQNTTLFGRQFDPYPVEFRFVQTHLLAVSPSSVSLLDALRKGHAYISFGILGDATGFEFYARTPRVTGLMGDSMSFEKDAVLSVRMPRTGHIRLIRNGVPIKDMTDHTLDNPVHDSGIYRVEVFLTFAGQEYPWIISNPIYFQ